MLVQRSEADQALLDGFLVKPITASMLFDAVADARNDQAQTHASGPGVTTCPNRLTGMRLLLAEDNLSNQQVARELLEYEGAIVQIANDGLEAVEAVAAADPPFDAVLMDLQMPVMDGFSATTRIRQKLNLQTLPIVAMTANVMASDREACLAAGMNDHVGKPFDINHLVRVLRKQTGRVDAPEKAQAVADLTLPASVRAAAVAAGVDVAAALNRLGHNLGLHQRMLRTFVKDLADLPAQLAACVAKDDVQSAARLLHTLKGQAGTLGTMTLSAEAARCEKQLTAGLAPSDAHVLVQQVSAAITAASPGVAALLQALQTAETPIAAPAKSLDTDAVLTQLRVITRHLQNADMAATDAMTDLQRQVAGALGDRLQAVDEAVGALDFDRALRLCNALINELTEELPA
jgi:CheY-like chemotaxis protein